jgi:alpha-L-fucosidase 2
LAIDEMLLQAFEGKLRVFADWPSGVDGRFGDLPACGAFRVSSDVRREVVQYVRIASEAGGSFTLVNPWPARTLRAYRNGADAGTLSGAEVSMTTASGALPPCPSWLHSVAGTEQSEGAKRSGAKRSERVEAE